ncbi:MAG: ribosome maturation factor RimM [Holosporales bacterium]|nr:ribosome maturation factor RimM [Holosporales bacterium]
MKSGSVCIGVISKPVGVKGDVKVRVFTETAESFLKIKGIFLETGAELKLLCPKVRSPTTVVAGLGLRGDRTAAESFRGKRLFAYLNDFPPLDDGEYYLESLVGMAAVDRSGNVVGHISASFDFGAGAFLDITTSESGNVATIQFNSTAILDIDNVGGIIKLDEQFILR